MGYPVQTKPTAMQQAAPYLGLGVQLAGTVLFCGALGYWADSKLASSPVGVLVGVVIGSVVGMMQFLRTVQKLSRAKELVDQNDNER
jgi:F0F1-type ATP synthase assembly protein I